MDKVQVRAEAGRPVKVSQRPWRLRASNFPRTLLWAISLAGWFLLFRELPQANGPIWDPILIMLLVAAAWANYLKIEVGPISVNQAFAFELLAVLILDPVRAAFLGVMAYLMGTGIPQRHAPWRNAVNAAIIGLSVLAMGKTYESLGGYVQLLPGDQPNPAHLWLILVASLSHFAVNSLLVYAIVLSRPNPPNMPAILRTMQWDVLAKFIFAPLAYYIHLAYGANNQTNLVPPILFILFIWLLLKNTMELTQARTELARNVDTLKRLHDISKEVYSSLDLTEVLETALSHATHLAGAEHGAIYLEDRYSDDAYLAHGLSPAPRWREYLEGAEMDWVVLAIRKPSEALPPGVRTLRGGGYHFQPTDPLAIELGIRRVLAYPLIESDQVVGVMVVAMAHEREPLESHHQTLAIISMEVTQAIGNARLHDTMKREFEKRQEELALAEKIQKRILPTDLEMPGVKVHTHFRPARSVGGDYYDLIPLADHRLAVVIGDISGKGVPAALTMMSVVNRLKVWTTGFRHPDRVLELLNESLVEPHRAFDEVLQYSTAVFGVLDTRTRRFTYSMAGHERPLLLHKGAPGPIPLEGEGYPLGLFLESTYTARTIELEPGDRLILFTDGIPDMQNRDGHRLSREYFYEIIARLHLKKEQHFAKAHFAELQDFGGMVENLADDQALLVIEITDEMPPTAPITLGAREGAAGPFQSIFETA